MPPRWTIDAVRRNKSDGHIIHCRVMIGVQPVFYYGHERRIYAFYSIIERGGA